jgi:zinc D-Ala-D-Ala carboxypeptidase
MNLSASFTLAEMTRSESAQKRGIDNTPPPEAVESLKALCEKVLQPLRDSLGKPLKVNSGYRGAAVNAAVGGSNTSQHSKGEAADIECNGFDNKQLAQKIISLKLPFDQLILENYTPGDLNSGWVHVSHKRTGTQRGEVLTATFVNGKPVYSKGLPK